MFPSKRVCGLHVGSVGLLAVFLYLVDRSLASLDGYVPGEDYPAYEEVPQGLPFTCDDKIPGYYADPDTRCQVWHWCVPGIGGNIIYSFICAPGTVFNQRLRVCDWFFKVDCPSSPGYYNVNEDLYKDDAGNYIAGKKDHSFSNNYKHKKWAVTRQQRTKKNKKTQDKHIPSVNDKKTQIVHTVTANNNKIQDKHILTVNVKKAQDKNNVNVKYTLRSKPELVTILYPKSELQI